MPPVPDPDAPGADELPQLSCLCVTERRSAFMPWLLWSFDRQTLRSKELVIVDSSPEPFSCDRSDVRVVSVPVGTNIPRKRNLALEAARGSVIAWFDDDDWQHPERLARLAAALADGHDFAGGSRSWFIDVHGGRCESYDGFRALIFNGAGFSAELARSVRFDETVRKASDTVWLRDVAAKKPRFHHLDEPLTAWLCHDENISNPRGRRRFASDLDELRRELGPVAWADTDRRLAELRAALPTAEPTIYEGYREGRGEPAGPDSRRAVWRRGWVRRDVPEVRDKPSGDEADHAVVTSVGGPSEPSRVEIAEAGEGMPAVALLLLAATADLELVAGLAAHVEQASRFPFAERILMLWSPDARADLAPLRAKAQASGLGSRFDRILTPPRYAASDVFARLFAHDSGEARPSLAPRLLAEGFGLFSSAAEHVLLCHAGVMFHGSGGSWLRESVLKLKADPRLLTVGTHPGPPIGPLGHPRSLSPAALSRVAWDRKHRFWRSCNQDLPYYLVDRRKIEGRLRGAEGDVASLAAWIGGSLSRSEAPAAGFHAQVAVKGSYAITAVPPARPQELRADSASLVLGIAELVRRGLTPSSQRGQFELAWEDGAWRRLLASERAA